MPIYFDSKAVIPAPFVSIKKDFSTTDDGAIIGRLYTIVVQGKLVAYKGSPDSSGTFWQSSGYPPDEIIDHDGRLRAILRKQKALRELFSAQNEGKTFEVVPLDGTASLKCNPRIKGVEFPADKWFDVCDYVITLEADKLYINGQEDTGDSEDYKVSNASEEWNLEILDENIGTYRLSHSVSAVGKRSYDDEGNLPLQAWENARDYVLHKIGLGIKAGRMTAPGVLDATSIQAYNYVRAQSVNELGGLFSVSENWVCYTPTDGIAAFEEFNINIRKSVNDSRWQVGIEGSITGLSVRNNSTHELIQTKWQGASQKWASVQSLLHSRCQTYSSLTLHSTPLNQVIGLNDISGTVTYSFDYDDRPTSSISGAISEITTISYVNPNDIYAELPVIGRFLGPILQPMGTTRTRKKTINIEVQMPPKSQSFTPTMPSTTALMLSYKPTSSSALVPVFVDNDEETWVPEVGRYNRTVTYSYQ